MRCQAPPDKPERTVWQYEVIRLRSKRFEMVNPSMTALEFIWKTPPVHTQPEVSNTRAEHSKSLGASLFDGTAPLSPSPGSCKIRVCPCAALVHPLFWFSVELSP
jgi:hypothetical protein